MVRLEVLFLRHSGMGGMQASGPGGASTPVLLPGGVLELQTGTHPSPPGEVPSVVDEDKG